MHTGVGVAHCTEIVVPPDSDHLLLTQAFSLALGSDEKVHCEYEVSKSSRQSARNHAFET